MSLEQAAYFSQTIAAVAVVGSLIYAALQVRTYTRANLDARVMAVQSDIQEFRRLIATDGDCARIYRDGLADFTRLDSTDQWRFGALMQMLVAYFDYQNRFADVYRRSEADPLIAQIVRRPGFQTWWRAGRAFYIPATIALIDRIAAAEG